MKKRKGIDLLSDHEGSGDPVEKGRRYRMTLKIWLHRGDPVLWTEPYGTMLGTLSEDRTAYTTSYRIDREQLFDGLFYAVLDMKVGGVRKVKIAPHLAYREKGVEGIIPPNALLIVEVSVVDHAK